MCDIYGYVHNDFYGDVHEDLLCVLYLPTNKTGAELFKSPDSYTSISGQLKLFFCAGICTDGAAAMTGRLSDLTAPIKEVAHESKSEHSVIHRDMLPCQKMRPEFNSILIDVAKVINHTKAHAFKSRLFEQLCEKMNAEHRSLFLYTEIR